MKQIAFVLRRRGQGTDPDKLAATADKALKQFPSTDALSIDQFQKKQDQQVNQLLGLVFALLALSVIVALLGIVNTLALSVHERTRELGMLRAVGMSRKQVKRMIRGESVITAGIGSILGTAAGHRLRRDHLAPAGRPGLRVHPARRLADPVLHPRRDRRRAGGDPAGAAGGEGGRAARRDHGVGAGLHR